MKIPETPDAMAKRSVTASDIVGYPNKAPTAIPESLHARLNRKGTAAALSEAGFPVSPATLATKATRGGGPPYQLFGRTPLYVWRDALEWAQSRLSEPVHSTSEALSMPRTAMAGSSSKAQTARTRSEK